MPIKLIDFYALANDYSVPYFTWLRSLKHIRVRREVVEICHRAEPPSWQVLQFGAGRNQVEVGRSRKHLLTGLSLPDLFK
jgi:hypothetical protein